MKWFFMFWTFGGMSLSGPYDTVEECRATAQASVDSAMYDSGFPPPPSAFCLQGEPIYRDHR